MQAWALVLGLVPTSHLPCKLPCRSCLHAVRLCVNVKLCAAVLIAARFTRPRMQNPKGPYRTMEELWDEPEAE